MSSIGQITVAHDDLMNHNPSRMTESSPAWPWTLWSFMSYNTLYTISWRVDLETFSSWWFCWYQSNKILNYQNLDSFQRLQPPVVISIALIDFEYISILNHELWGISITWNFQTHYFIGNLNLGRTRGKVMQITCRENREQQLVINRPIGISLNYIRSRITFVETEKLATSMFVYEVMPSVWIMDIFWLHNPRFINIRGIIFELGALCCLRSKIKFQVLGRTCNVQKNMQGSGQRLTAIIPCCMSLENWFLCLLIFFKLIRKLSARSTRSGWGGT